MFWHQGSSRKILIELAWNIIARLQVMIQNLCVEIYFYRQYAIKDKFGWWTLKNLFIIKMAEFYAYLLIENFLTQNIFNFL